MIDPPTPLRLFPIMCGERSDSHKSWIPWSVIAPHEAQAQSNHDQTLTRLAERGGLAPCEAVAVLEDRAWHAMDQSHARRRLGLLVADFIATLLPSTPLRISGEKETKDMDTRQSSPCPTSTTGSPRSQPDGSGHMPTPWHVGPYYTTDVESSRGRVCECSPLSAPTAIANAAFIVRACNSHADLLAAAKRSLDWLASYQGNAALPAYEQMRAAIAKAEGR
jgi:hypothetical protein